MSISGARAKSGASTTRAASTTRPRGRQEHALSPALRDEGRVCLLAVDTQNTFCTPGFELFVAGRSGSGALDDSRRLCAFVYHQLGLITQTVVTLDTHQAFHDLPRGLPRRRRRSTPRSVHARHARGRRRRSLARRRQRRPRPLELDDADGYLAGYVEALARGGKYDLTIWPFHAMLGGIGHALVSALEEALFFHAIARRSQTRFEVKGRHPLTEHYSVLGPEVQRDSHGAVRSASATPRSSSTSTGSTRSSSPDRRRATASRGRSPISSPTCRRSRRASTCSRTAHRRSSSPGAVDYSDDAHEAFARFAEAGAHVVRSTDPVETWPGGSPRSRLGDRSAIAAETGRCGGDRRRARPPAVVKENYDRRRYSLPGGALEADESALDTVVREALEETGVEIAVDHVIGVYRLENGFTATLFRCSISNGEPTKPETGEIAEVAWFARDEIPQPRSNLLHHALEDIVPGARRSSSAYGLPRGSTSATRARAARSVRRCRPTFAEGRPSVITTSAVKSFSPRMSDDPTPYASTGTPRSSNARILSTPKPPETTIFTSSKPSRVERVADRAHEALVDPAQRRVVHLAERPVDELA